VDKTTTGQGTAKDPDRVAVRLDPDTRRRLRVFAANQGRPIQAVLAGWIADQLPSDDELADAVRGGASRD
jgi:hypothetical protein